MVRRQTYSQVRGLWPWTGRVASLSFSKTRAALKDGARRRAQSCAELTGGAPHILILSSAPRLCPPVSDGAGHRARGHLVIINYALIISSPVLSTHLYSQKLFCTFSLFALAGPVTGAREQVTVSDFPDEETGLERAATRSRPRSRRGMEAASESAPIPSSAGCPFSVVSQPRHVDLKTRRLGEAKQKGLAELWGPRREASALRGSHVLKLLWLGVGWAVSRRGGRRGASRRGRFADP